MANAAADFLRALAARLRSRPVPPQRALVRIRSPQVLPPEQQRMIGWNAGMPQGKLVDKVLATTGAIPLRGEAPTDYQRDGTTVRVRGFERHPVVQACTRAIVDIASAVPLQVYRKTPAKTASGFSDDVQVMTSAHPLQRLLDTPNSFLSAQRFRALSLIHYILYGNSITFLERPTPDGATTGEPGQDYAPNLQPPQSLRIVHPEFLTTVYVNHKGYPVWYVWRDMLGYPHTSPVTDLLHVRDLNAYGLVFGYPRAASALNDIIGDDEASQFTRQMVTNGGMPGGYALVNEETTIAEAKAAEEAFYEKMVTRGGRGRFAFIGGVKDVKTLAFNLKDLEFPDLRRVTREDICSAFGVDPRMVGISTATRDAGMSGEQYIEARVRLIKQTIEPMMRGFESEMNLWLAPEFGDVYVRFDPDALAGLAENKNATSTRVLAELGGGARTVQETREALELPSEFDTDDLLAPASTVAFTPVALALEPPPEPTGAVGPDGKPLAPATPKADATAADSEDAGTAPGRDKGKAGSTETDLQGTTGVDPNTGKAPKITQGSADVSGKQRGSLVLGSRILQRGMVLTDEQRIALWRQFDTRAAKDEAPYRRQAMILFGEERATVGHLVSEVEQQGGPDETALAKRLKRRVRQLYQPDGDLMRRWVDRFHPLIGATYAKGGEHVAAGLRARGVALQRTGPKKKPISGDPPAGGKHVAFDFHLQNPKVQDAIRERAARLASLVTDTTGQAVTDAIEIGLREGMSLREIATLINQTAFGGGATYRATMIARTETIGALNQGEHDTAKDSGVIAGKEWLTQGDERVRDSHFECEGEGMIGLDDTFATNGMAYPGDPAGEADEVINCRCTLLYYDTLEDGTSSIEGAGEAMSAADAGGFMFFGAEGRRFADQLLGAVRAGPAPNTNGAH